MTALTAAHVVRSHDESSGDVDDLGPAKYFGKEELRLLPVGGPSLLALDEVTVDERLDVARLRLTHARLAWAPLQRSWEVGMRVVSHGFSLRFPEVRFPYGHPMDVTEVSGQVQVVWKGSETAVLRLKPANADRGFSGGPVIDVVTGAVIGILRLERLADGGIYATPAANVLDLWSDLAELGDPSSLPASGVHPYRGLWRSFDPDKLHVVVVDAETTLTESFDKLSDAVRELRAQSVAADIWAAFGRYWRGRPLLRGRAARPISEQQSANDFRLASFSVVDAYSTRARLAEAIRLVVEADVALFDMTGFEPGVMLLLGVRAATKRGVTISSHGSWQEGSPLARPFNLSDLALASHSPAGTVGADPRIELIGNRIVAGFQQMIDMPRYQDLPAYDGIRQLGPRHEAWSTVPLETMVLALCSYDDAFFENWKMLRREIADALDARGHRTVQVGRLIDMRRPQLVSQALYDRIRRCSACVTDWTGWSPSTFFEMGARLAISPWGSVQVVDDQWLDDQDVDAGGRSLDQQKAMLPIFDPIRYRGKADEAIGGRVADELLAVKQTAGVEGGSFIRSVVIGALSRVQEARPDVAAALLDEANSFHHLEQAQRNTTQTLFPELREAKIEQEDAALQRRIAAWLYLEYREGAGQLPSGDPKHQLWREIGEALSGALYDGTAEDQAFAETIEQRMDR